MTARFVLTTIQLTCLCYGLHLSVNINDMHIIILRVQKRIACTLSPKSKISMKGSDTVNR